MKKLFYILGIVLLTACGSLNKKALSEGVIEYSATPIDNENPMAALAPGSMTVLFNHDKYAAEMSTMGIFTTNFIANPDTKTLTQTVKFMDIKQATIETESDIKEEMKLYPLTFEKTKETKEICGYKCFKAIATKVDEPAVTFDVYYTKEMNVEHPNFASPYGELDGMLMEFRLKKFGLEMEFKATAVKKEEVPDETFTLPGYFKIVSKQEMEKFFADLK